MIEVTTPTPANCIADLKTTLQLFEAGGLSPETAESVVGSILEDYEEASRPMNEALELFMGDAIEFWK